MIPFIPLLAIAAIVGGVATLDWYYGLSREEQIRADRKAMHLFRKSFKALSEAQQSEVRRRM